MDIADMIRLMRLVKKHEDAHSVQALIEAGSQLCRAVRSYIEVEAEISGSYEELMWVLGEGE